MSVDSRRLDAMTHQTSDASGILPWQTGDLILSADRKLWVRADTESVAQGWPWRNPPEQWDMSRAGGEGSVSEEQIQRPVTLLVRGGEAIGGVVIDDRAIKGTAIRKSLAQKRTEPPQL